MKINQKWWLMPVENFRELFYSVYSLFCGRGVRVGNERNSQKI